MAVNVNQYAVKVVEGTIAPNDPKFPLGPGIYFTSINVHNPGPSTVKYWTKFAAAGDHGAAGEVGDHVSHSLKDDEVTQFYRMDFPPAGGGFREGYFVITCDKAADSLDVVGVYTGSALGGNLATMEIERVPAQKVLRPQLPT